MKTLTRPSRSKLPQPVTTARFWLGVNLHRLRKAKGLTQEKLAQAAELSARRLRDIENAVPESNPELKTISALAGALGVGVGDLFKVGKEGELVEV